MFLLYLLTHKLIPLIFLFKITYLFTFILFYLFIYLFFVRGINWVLVVFPRQQSSWRTGDPVRRWILCLRATHCCSKSR